MEEGSLAGGRAVGRHGNTAEGRLARLDVLLRLFEPSLFDRTHSPKSPEMCVDVGFGDAIHTFADFAAALSARREGGSLRVLGTESDPARLAAGLQAMEERGLGADRSLALRLAEAGASSFRLPLEPDEPPLVAVRALNVLRDYHPADALRAMHALGDQLAPGGLLLEGSASTCGHTAAVALVRAPAAAAAATAGAAEACRALCVEAVAFCVDLDRRQPKLKGMPHRWFSRHLPQIWQHQRTKAAAALGAKRKRGSLDSPGSGGGGAGGGGGVVGRFLAAWAAVCADEEARLAAMSPAERGREDTGPRRRWERTVAALGGKVGGVDTSDRYVRQGFLVWRPPGGLPLADAAD